MKLMTAVATTLFLAAGAAMATPPAGSAAPVHNSAKHCEKEATAKNLKGEDRAKFIKECETPKQK